MGEAYRGRADDRRFRGTQADITYSLKRCVHAQECVRRLSSVFDNQRRPWIDANGASADDVLEVVRHCPSGALHVDRHDGGPEESTPTANEGVLWANGPIQLTGDLHIVGAGVDVEGETRVTLCRCGQSKNKPFCDNSHKDIQFVAEEKPRPDVSPLTEREGRLTVTAHSRGPLQLSGPLELRGSDGSLQYAGNESWLCRCGGSSNKPFCDSTHRRNGFAAD
ncbi:MAG: CDGSH iron-sulfur domain-containing protein [Chloroflexi bacterium]|nr:CDGSH iron-sulfur domain-containing protein [Chloroflexota bacterium]